MICLHIDLCGISHPQNSSVVYPLEYQMSAQDTELMHLTAESTSADFGSLVTQAVSRPPDRKIKTGKEEDAEAWWGADKGRKRREEGGTVIGTLCSAHLLIWQTANIISHRFLR